MYYINILILLYFSVFFFGGLYKGCIFCFFVFDINVYYDIIAF